MVARDSFWLKDWVLLLDLSKMSCKISPFFMAKRKKIITKFRSNSYHQKEMDTMILWWYHIRIWWRRGIHALKRVHLPPVTHVTRTHTYTLKDTPQKSTTTTTWYKPTPCSYCPLIPLFLTNIFALNKPISMRTNCIINTILGFPSTFISQIKNPINIYKL